jgi:hypothetical protein
MSNEAWVFGFGSLGQKAVKIRAGGSKQQPPSVELAAVQRTCVYAISCNEQRGREDTAVGMVLPAWGATGRVRRGKAGAAHLVHPPVPLPPRLSDRG